MKVVAIYGSARRNGNTTLLVDTAIDYLGKEHEIKKHYLFEKNIKPCLGCFACRTKEGCVIKNDDMGEIFEDIIHADFVIFSSPLYCLDVSGMFKLMYDRLYPMVEGKRGFYTPRYKGIRCMTIITQGAPTIMFRAVRKRLKMCYKLNGFDNMGIVVSGLANEKGSSIKQKMTLKKIERICKKANIQ